MFLKIEKSGVSPRDKKLIEESLPSPKEYAGWKFKEYVWINPNEIITDKTGETGISYTDNSVRLGGTPNTEELEELLRRGLDTSKLTISVKPDFTAINGFTRIKKLIKLGYREWIVAIYEPDFGTKTEFQDPEHEEHFLDDMRLGANAGDGSTPATTLEFQEIGIKRFENRSDKSSLAIQRWVNSINHSFSKKQVEAIANHVMKHHKREGVVEKVTREEAEDIVAKVFPNKDVDLVNTKTTTYAQRHFYKVQHALINGHDPTEFVTFHSDATTHEEVTKSRQELNVALMKMHTNAFEYVHACNNDPTHTPWKNLGAIGQKIGDEEIKKVV